MTRSGKGQWYDMRLRHVDPGFINEAADHVSNGATVKQTARLMGVPPGTMRAWLRTGADQLHEAYETGERKHMLHREAALFLAIERAAGARAVELIGEIRGATKDDEWRSAAWLLERYESEEFGDTKRVEVTGELTGRVEVQVDHEHTLAGLVAVGVVQPGAAAAVDAKALELLPARTD